MPRLTGHFAVFDQWTQIRSKFEGHFLERIAPGAFAKTFREDRSRMRVLFQHGKDPTIGDKPLGSIERLEEDDVGAAYEVQLFDTAYVRELLPGLQAGVYGASFRFSATREDVNPRPPRSAHNPEGIQERTVLEASVREFGPVTWAAYAGASAGVRAMTDQFLDVAVVGDPYRGTGRPRWLLEEGRDPTSGLLSAA
jgi:hypothetical protein